MTIAGNNASQSVKRIKAQIARMEALLPISDSTNHAANFRFGSRPASRSLGWQGLVLILLRIVFKEYLAKRMQRNRWVLR